MSSLPSQDIEVGKSFNFTVSNDLERDSDNVTWSKVCPEWCNTDISEQQEFVSFNEYNNDVSIAPSNLKHIGNHYFFIRQMPKVATAGLFKERVTKVTYRVVCD
jgi:hypothetical protein